MIDVLMVILFVAAFLVVLAVGLKTPLDEFRRKRKYQAIVTKLNELFALTDPFLLSQTERKRLQRAELYYGEMDICAFLDLLEAAAPKPNAIFYDLGSGCGKLVLAAKLSYPTLNARGIELLQSLHAMSELKCYESQLSNVKFINDDFLNQSLADADIVFINATGFTDQTFPAVLQHLRTLQPGAKVIITSKQLPNKEFRSIYQGMEKTSWGLTSCFVYERI